MWKKAERVMRPKCPLQFCSYYGEPYEETNTRCRSFFYEASEISKKRRNEIVSAETGSSYG
jgi:hypothetical protein